MAHCHPAVGLLEPMPEGIGRRRGSGASGPRPTSSSPMPISYAAAFLLRLGLAADKCSARNGQCKFSSIVHLFGSLRRIPPEPYSFSLPYGS
ncbi:hypothetical protein SCA6_019047 [Theobroma cacao]